MLFVAFRQFMLQIYVIKHNFCVILPVFTQFLRFFVTLFHHLPRSPHDIPLIEAYTKPSKP